jgi:hypothetical protein
MKQSVDRHDLEKVSEKILYKGVQDKSKHFRNKSTTSSLGVLEYCNFPNPDSLKEGMLTEYH